MTFSSGVYPTYGITFKINKAGRTTETTDMVTIADMESFSPSIDGSVEEWTPMTTDGWQRALMTGKKLSFSLKGKRNVGDAGNDYIASCAWKDGLDCGSKAEIEFPDGATLKFDCIVDVKTPFGGESTNVSTLEFDLVGDGKPAYTPAVSS